MPFEHLMRFEPHPGWRLLVRPVSLGYTESESVGFLHPDMPISHDELALMQHRLNDAFIYLANVECEGTA